ncbi:MAG: cytochrome P450 [Alphaproteobacteria bacterium]|nr:cytochrome P450 [Alphaproteobacteria bacterium]
MSNAMVAERQDQADVNAIPLDRIDVSVPRLYEQDTIGPYFTRLRREDPVHYCAESLHGPYWSVTKFNDIVRVEVDHQTFSSESKLGGVVIDNINNRVETQDFELPMFIAMDPPKHDEQRKVVSPIVAPPNLALLEPVIRERAGLILDSLPVGEEIDWVDLVSIELTTMTLATLFDFPWEDRRKLTRWSDVATATPATGIISSWDQWKAELLECAQYFKVLWDRRVNEAPKADLVSMLAHSPATRNMPFQEFLGNLMLLIVGGNDTTRSSISGGVIALNRYPDQYRKLMADPSLISKMVPEIIRWQTPLAHMRRTALADADIGGKKIKAGDKVVMWYLSGNRDEEVIDRPEDFIIDRATPRHHLSFGFGIHRCVGNRLAEMQLRIIWEEIVKRYRKVEVVGEPVRTLSNFIHGFTRLPVKLHAH